MNFYPFHIGDFRSGTLHLSDEEELAYRRALDWYYDTEQPIPLETQWVARRLRVKTEVLDLVLKDFFIETSEGWKHERCDVEIAAYHQKAEKNRENGRKGGRPKANKDANKNPVGSQSVSDGMPVESETNLNQEPLTKNQEPKEKSKPLSGRPDDDAKPGEILDYLNRKTGKAFKPVAANLRLIRGRLAEGIKPHELTAVVDRKIAEWTGTKFETYLRPETLFGATKCNQYVGELSLPCAEEEAERRVQEWLDEPTGHTFEGAIA